MKRVLLIVFLLLIVGSSTVSAEQVYRATDVAGTAPVNTVVPTSSTNSSVGPTTVTRRYEVTSENSYQFLKKGDFAVITRYLAKYRKHLDPGNYAFLEQGLQQIVGNGTIDARDSSGRLILGSRPVDYIRMIQQYCGDLTGTDRYVDVEIPTLPAFNGGGAQGPLVLDAVPAVEQARAVAYVQTASPGAMALSHAGDRQETPIASGFVSWKKIPPQPVPEVKVVCPPQPPPPPPPVTPPPPPNGPYCPGINPPVQPPTDPTSNATPSQDSTFDEPNPAVGPVDPANANGYLAPGGPPLASGDQASVVIGDGTGITPPPLTGIYVADPVIPVPVTLVN